MTFGSLFAGIGGFDLGFERAGMQCLWQVEKDAWCRSILAKHWPHVERYEDVCDVGKHNLRTVDVICGGFPCQDVSIAGKQAGIGEGTRSGLWSQFHRIIGELRPRYAVLENVRNLLSGDNGRWFGRVLGDLAEIGYDAEWEVLSASAFGADHERKRVYVVAYSNTLGLQGGVIKKVCGVKTFAWLKDCRSIKDLFDRPDIPQPLIPSVANGVSNQLGGLGNAVVPQIAEYIGQCLMAHNRAHSA